MAGGVSEPPVTGQVALVTGAGQGIGRAIALRLAVDGMDLVIADLNHAQVLAVAAEIQALGRRAYALGIDIAQAADRERMISETLAAFGRLDVLVNNAGVQRVAHPFDVTEQHWDLVMGVNAKATYFCCVLALKQMLEQGSGRIINLASVAGKSATTIEHPIYNISKAAVIAMTKTLAMTVAARGIRVNSICPGMVETPMQGLNDREFARVAGKPPEQVRSERMGRVPIGRIASPDEIAAVVSFLAGPDSRYMTGQAINVSGGMITY